MSIDLDLEVLCEVFKWCSVQFKQYSSKSEESLKKLYIKKR